MNNEYEWDAIVEKEIKEKRAKNSNLMSELESRLKDNPDFKELGQARKECYTLGQPWAGPDLLKERELEFANCHRHKTLFEKSGETVYRKLMEYFNLESGKSSEVYGVVHRSKNSRGMTLFNFREGFSVEEMKELLQRGIERNEWYHPSKKQVKELTYIIGDNKNAQEQKIWHELNR
jgi:hypothetical protein